MTTPPTEHEENPVSTEALPLGDVLSVTTGLLVSRDHIGGVYRVCDFMTGVANFTHQLPRTSARITPAIFEQHPELAEVEDPCWESPTAAEVERWLSQQEERFGATVDLTPIADYEPTGVLDDLVEMMAEGKAERP